MEVTFEPKNMETLPPDFPFIRKIAADKPPLFFPEKAEKKRIEREKEIERLATETVLHHYTNEEFLKENLHMCELAITLCLCAKARSVQSLDLSVYGGRKPFMNGDRLECITTFTFAPTVKTKNTVMASALDLQAVVQPAFSFGWMTMFLRITCLPSILQMNGTTF